MMDSLQKRMLLEIADLEGIPKGAYNIRSDSSSIGRASTENIEIVSKKDKDGIDIIIKPGTKNESVHIPVIINKAGIKENVYNDFIIGEDADVTIVAGCGIHCGGGESRHDGIHTFKLAKGARVRYIEKHYGEDDEKGEGTRIMNPTTVAELGEGAYMEMETTQIRGINSTKRVTKATCGKGATFVVREKILTHGEQNAETDFQVDLAGENSSSHVISRAVAKDKSNQLFTAKIYGNAKCHGHSECDAIIMDEAKIAAVPEIKANHLEASLVHEATIGKIAGEQLTKLMTLGLTEKEAENQIINGFLK